VGRIEGGAVFVAGAAPGDLVEVELARGTHPMRGALLPSSTSSRVGAAARSRMRRCNWCTSRRSAERPTPISSARRCEATSRRDLRIRVLPGAAAAHALTFARAGRRIRVSSRLGTHARVDRSPQSRRCAPAAIGDRRGPRSAAGKDHARGATIGRSSRRMARQAVVREPARRQRIGGLGRRRIASRTSRWRVR
jgi:hypothetical protein